MCFSTTASFAAGTLLTTIGALCLSKTENKSEIMFASIPIVFGLQQFSEGLVWLSLTNSVNFLSQQVFAHAFLCFALVIWPSWVPLAFLFLEKNLKRKKILRIISALGLLFSMASIYYLIAFHSRAQIAFYHIHYDLEISNKILLIAGSFYLIPTIASHFISSVKLVPVMGFLVLLSHIISRIFFKETLLSVWCFFAAIISIMIYYILIRKPSALKDKSYIPM